MAKPILISGIQTSGRLHLGNYLGALKNFVDLQNSEKYECYFFLADLHSLTEAYEPKEKNKQVVELAADFLAAGLDPEKSVIFQQSQVPAHTELAWILNTITPMGELRRMTQFKDKKIQILGSELKKQVSLVASKGISAVAGASEDETINVGLFDYPVLMAADILLYNAKVVPVGDDQKQHLELTRTLARKFNARFGETFVEPQPLFTQATRVMNLGEPERKMSKSRSHPQNVIYTDDEPEEIKSKIKSAVTDSGSEIKYDIVKKPAISNLITIYSAISGEEIKKIEKKFVGKTYSEFKTDLADLLIDHFADFRRRKRSLLQTPAVLKKVIASGSKQAAKVADKKVADVKKKVGILI